LCGRRGFQNCLNAFVSWPQRRRGPEDDEKTFSHPPRPLWTLPNYWAGTTNRGIITTNDPMEARSITERVKDHGLVDRRCRSPKRVPRRPIRRNHLAMLEHRNEKAETRDTKRTMGSVWMDPRQVMIDLILVPPRLFASTLLICILGFRRTNAIMKECLWSWIYSIGVLYPSIGRAIR
jgi:hypothetical protein